MIKKRVSFSLGKLILFLIIIILIIYLIFFSGVFKKNCKFDKDCFDNAFMKCKKAKFVLIKDNNIYDYLILGKEKDDCKVKIKVRSMAIGTPIDLVNKFEGKEMICKIPRKSEIKIDEMKNFINYCSGPLKEAMYEVIINKLYGLVIRNMGDIIAEVEKGVY